MYRLCWVSKDMNNPYSGVPQAVPFKTIEEIIKLMSRCYYNGEWVIDNKGNQVKIDLSKVCAKRR